MITNGKGYREWANNAGLVGRDSMSILSLLNRRENADIIISQALKRNWSKATMESALAGSNPNQTTQPVSPVFAPDPVQREMPDEDGGYSDAESEAEKPGFFQKLFPKRKTAGSKTTQKKWYWIGGGAIALIVLVLLIGFMSSMGGSPQYDLSGETLGEPSFIDPGSIGDPALGFATQTPQENVNVVEEVMPVLENPKPLDFVSNPWLKGLQLLIFVELIGVIISVLGDSKFREQWVDSIVSLVCAMVTIFLVVPAGVPVWFASVLLVAIVGIVGLVSFMGGRDFSPTSAYCLVVGIVGGLIFNKIGLLQGVFRIASSPVLPMVQIGILFKLQSWALMAFPLMVYLIIAVGVIFAILEGVRPSEDKTYRWGTIVSAVFGLLIYFVFLYPVHLAAWISYVIAFSASITISSLSQNERVIRVVTNKWGIRSPFDGAMLVTGLLLIIQIITGTVGLF